MSIEINAQHDGDTETMHFGAVVLGPKPYLLFTIEEADDENTTVSVMSGGGVPNEQYGEFLSFVQANIQALRNNTNAEHTSVELEGDLQRRESADQAETDS